MFKQSSGHLRGENFIKHAVGLNGLKWFVHNTLTTRIYYAY